MNESKTYAKLGYTLEETEKVVSKLNVLLANYHIHYQKLRKFHWNVTGAEFFDIHEILEAQYNETQANIDEIAERIRIFGKKPMSTLTDYLENSTIEEVHGDLSADKMVQEVLSDFEVLVKYIKKATQDAIAIEDFGTIDMLNSMVKKMEKTHWMLHSFHLKEA